MSPAAGPAVTVEYPSTRSPLRTCRGCGCTLRACPGGCAWVHAKVYRGGGYRGMAYDKKQWSMDNLCKALAGYGHDDHTFRWGWAVDVAQHRAGSPHHHVLYVELPTGQVSFHTDRRGEGPDYPGQWDGMPGQSADRICRWAGRLLAQEAVAS